MKLHRAKRDKWYPLPPVGDVPLLERIGWWFYERFSREARARKEIKT